MIKIGRVLRLKDQHPTMVKLHKLLALAEDLKITLSFGQYQTTVHDGDRDPNLPPLYLEYVDGDNDPNSETVMEWPPTFDFTAKYENPAYIAAQKEERAKLERSFAEKRKKAEEELATAKALQEQDRQRQIEVRERLQLATLKAKYEGST